MTGFISNDDQEPIILGFTAVNKASPASNQAALKQAEVPTPSTEPPKKRRKKQNQDDSVQSNKAPKAVKKKTAVESKQKNTVVRDKINHKAKEAVLVKTNKLTVVLSETTKSKLNSFRYNALPTPASEDDLYDENLENVPPANPPQEKIARIEEDGDRNSDDLISSDLWQNYEPLNNYPWTLRAYHTQEPQHTSQDEPVESRYFADYLQTEAKQSTRRNEDNLMSDEELDRLLENMDDTDLNGFIPTSNQDQTSAVPDVIGESAENFFVIDDATESDFAMDLNDLDELIEMTSTGNSPAKQQPNSSTTNEMESMDVDDGERQDLLDLIYNLPELALETENSPKSNSGDVINKVPPTFPAESLVDSSPQKPQADPQGVRARFVRPAHPSALEIPGPIPGLSPEKRILTCFRIGEAINATIIAQRQGFKVFIELYARVTHSTRAGPVQTFRIVDLWSRPDKLGIILEGRWAGWDKDDLWEKDSRVFWEDGFRDMEYDEQGRERPYARKCRIVGCLERKPAGGWAIDILNLWEAGWDDVAFTKQVFCEPEEDTET